MPLAVGMTKDMNTLADWTPRPMPGSAVLTGRFVVVEPYAADHLSELYGAVAGPENDNIWTYMPVGPFHTVDAFEAALADMTGPKGWKVMLIRCAKTGRALGTASYMRLRPEHGSAEIGTVAHGKAMRRTPHGTEAHYLLARHVFEGLGYRRYEWKCNAANAASMAAAARYGFTYEGIFRQDMVTKGENRDTAWFSMLDGEWPALKHGYETWLAPDNFDASGAQITPLCHAQRTL